jgi:two-component system sensor histidine kinase KdpD
MVAVDAASFGKDLIRRGWSLARGLRAPLLVVHVHRPSRHYTQDEEASLRANLDLAEDLGAETVIIQNEDVAGSLALLAREKHITQIVMGKSQQSRFKSMLSRSLPTRLTEMVAQDIHLVQVGSNETPVYNGCNND